MLDPDQKNRGRTQESDLCRGWVLWAGPGRRWGSNHRPGQKKRPRFQRRPDSDALRYQQRHAVVSTLRPPAHNITHSAQAHRPKPTHPPPTVTIAHYLQGSSSSSSSDPPFLSLLTASPTWVIHTAFTQAPPSLFHHFQTAGGFHSWREVKPLNSEWMGCTSLVTLLIFSFGCARSAGK